MEVKNRYHHKVKWKKKNYRQKKYVSAEREREYLFNT